MFYLTKVAAMVALTVVAVTVADEFMNPAFKISLYEMWTPP